MKVKPRRIRVYDLIGDVILDVKDCDVEVTLTDTYILISYNSAYTEKRRNVGYPLSSISKFDFEMRV